MTYSSRTKVRRRFVRSVVENLEPRQLMHAGHDHTIRIDSGTTAPYTDTLGNIWQADAGFIGGGVDTKSFTVAGTPDPKLFTSRRAGEFKYSIPTDDGAYTLNLLFADWVTTAGTRKFNVAAEGQPILTNFDIAASGGGQKALIKSFNMTVTGGALDLSFTKLVGNPVVSAIELIPVDTTPTPPTAPIEFSARALSSSRIGLNWTDTAGNETAFEIERSTDGGTTFLPLITLSGSDHTSHADENLSPATKYVYRVRAVNGAGPSSWSNVAEATTSPLPPPGGLTTLRVDAAGAANFTDSTGKVWLKEFGFTGGAPNTGLFAVSGTVDDALYATRRTGEFTFSAPVTSGDYTLRLLFADYYAAGKRRFNVSAEGQQILTNFDISAEAGVNAALVKTFNVKITDGKLDLAFKNVLGNSSLSALELVPAEPVTLPATPSNLLATGKTGGRADLTWSDNSNNESNFEIWRAINGGTRSLVHTVGANVTTWTDSGLSPANTYTYWVRATNSAGPSDYSNADNAQPIDGPATDTWTTITWTTLTVSAAPIARAEALKAVIDGKLYVFAGFSGSAGPVVRSDVFDPATGQWSPLPNMPTRLTHAGVTTVDHDVYFAGGYIGTGPGYQQQFGTEQVWRYNIDTKQYTAMPNLPAKLAGGGLVAVGRNLHYFGGNNSSRQDVAVHYVLNLDNLPAGWVAKKSMLTARSHMGYVNLGGKIYAVGGQKGNDENLTAQSAVEVYDPSSDTWTSKASLPKGINHISSSTFVMGGRILTLGGQTAHGSSIADCYAYDPDTNKWVTLTSLPAPRFSGVADVINGTIYFTGGSGLTTTYKGVPG